MAQVVQMLVLVERKEAELSRVADNIEKELIKKDELRRGDLLDRWRFLEAQLRGEVQELRTGMTWWLPSQCVPVASCFPFLASMVTTCEHRGMPPASAPFMV